MEQRRTLRFVQLCFLVTAIAFYCSLPSLGIAAAILGIILAQGAKDDDHVASTGPRRLQFSERLIAEGRLRRRA